LQENLPKVQERHLYRSCTFDTQDSTLAAKKLMHIYSTIGLSPDCFVESDALSNKAAWRLPIGQNLCIFPTGDEELFLVLYIHIWFVLVGSTVVSRFAVSVVVDCEKEGGFPQWLLIPLTPLLFLKNMVWRDMGLNVFRLRPERMFAFSITSPCGFRQTW
jgi:hypothetical protein